MSSPDRLRRLIRLPARDRTIAADVDAELAFHLECAERELMARGMSAEGARREARRRFGNVEAVRGTLRSMGKEGTRRERRSVFWRGWWEDLARGARTLLREPSYVAVVALTLALGMGANAMMFRVIDRILLRPAPHVRDDGSLSLLYFQRETPEFGRVTFSSQSYPASEQMRAAFTPMGDLAAWWTRSASSGRGAQARKLDVGYVTPNLFNLLGVRAWSGRAFDAADWMEGGEPSVVLTHGFATREFGVAAAAVGKTLPIGDTTYTVIGVTPPGFTGATLRHVDAFVTMQSAVGAAMGENWRTNTNMRWLQVVARRAPGTSAEQAGAAMTAALHDFGRASAKDDTLTTVIAGSIIPARRPDGSTTARITLWLGGVALLVLLVACANVANLMLARTLRRRRELAVHLALGISRARITRVLLSEALIVGALAGAVALALASWGEGLLRATLLDGMAWEGAAIDGRSAAFVALLVVAVAVLAGAAPAALAAHTPLMDTLKSGIREGGGRRRRLRSALVVVQGTLSVILLVGGGLFVRSFTRASSLELGFAPDGLLVVNLDVSLLTTTADGHEARWRGIEEAVRAVPGVTAVAQSVTVPFESQWSRELLVDGDTLPPVKGGGPYVDAVSAGYFRTMGTPIRRGRDFTEADRAGSAPVTIVSERMAALLWPGKEAVGACLHLAESPGCVTVIGVVPDGRMTALADEPPPQFFQPLGQWSPRMRSLMVRTSSGGAGAIEAVRRAIVQAEPSLPYVSIRPMPAIVDEQLQPWRLGATLFAIFGLLGLGVAALGLYSVVAHDVAQRTREIGVRLALGARRADVARLVLADGVRQALAGVALGVAIAWLASRRIADLLFDTSPRDPAIYLAVIAVLLLVAVVASLVPARRATRVDPAEVLRAD